jgi:hypothetical protein
MCSKILKGNSKICFGAKSNMFIVIGGRGVFMMSLFISNHVGYIIEFHVLTFTRRMGTLKGSTGTLLRLG